MSWKIRSPRAHNSVKYWPITTKLKLDLQLSIVSNHTTFHFNIWKINPKNVQKTEIVMKIPSWRAHNSVKNWSITTKIKLDLQLIIANNHTKFHFNIRKNNPKYVWKTEIFMKILSPRAHNSVKYSSITTKLKLDL